MGNKLSAFTTQSTVKQASIQAQRFTIEASSSMKLKVFFLLFFFPFPSTAASIAAQLFNVKFIVLFRIELLK
jgi:hypothetical protein